VGSNCTKSWASIFRSATSAQELRLDYGRGRGLDRYRRSLDGLSITPPSPGDRRSTRLSVADGQRTIRFGDRSRFLAWGTDICQARVEYDAESEGPESCGPYVHGLRSARCRLRRRSQMR
jgi:hypothetical protein